MSTFIQDKQFNRDHGKFVDGQQKTGDRYGNVPRNNNRPIRRQENISMSEEFFVKPPLWLDSYMDNFKKKFMVELTDNIVKAIEPTSKTIAEQRRYKSIYFSMKSRLVKMQAEKTDCELQIEKLQQQIASTENNSESKVIENNLSGELTRVPNEEIGESVDKHCDKEKDTINKGINEVENNIENSLNEKITAMKLNDKSSIIDQSTVDNIKVNASLDEKMGIKIDKLLLENFDVVFEKIKKSETETSAEQQQEIVSNLFQQAIDELNNSILYAQLCQQFAIKYECIMTLCDILKNWCNDKLTAYKKIIEDDTKSDGFMGVILFIGELYNQKLLSKDIIEDYIGYFWENDTELNLKYLCEILCLVGKDFEFRTENITRYVNHLIKLFKIDKSKENINKPSCPLMELIDKNYDEPLTGNINLEIAEIDNTNE